MQFGIFTVGDLTQDPTTGHIISENERIKNRQLTVDKHIVQVEAEVNSLRQKLVLSEDEKRALQTAFEKSAGDATRLTRRLAETENNLNATMARLRNTEERIAETEGRMKPLDDSERSLREWD